MPLDPNSHVPVYEQIVEHVLGLVSAGVYRAEEALPSVRALALELLVNPNTIQRAYQELERQGFVYTRKGLGVFVANNGAVTARDKSEAAIQDRFIQGINVGRAAKIDERRMEEIFRNALNKKTTQGESKGTIGPREES